MMQDIVNEIAEMTIKNRAEYVARRLEELGYSREYVRENKYDFIVVNTGQNILGVVYVPEQRVLFWFKQEFRQTRQSGELILNTMHGGDFEISFSSYYPRGYGVDLEMEQWAMKCAQQAREQALAALQ